jgi:hypothetical protein
LASQHAFGIAYTTIDITSGLSANTIAAIYKDRWAVGLFFA